MKIDNSSKPITPGSSGANSAGRARSSAGNAAPASAAPSPAATATTEATLSGLQGLSSMLATSPPVDSARVAEIKQAIAEGRFQINPERIADGLLQSVHDMLAGSHE